MWTDNGDDKTPLVLYRWTTRLTVSNFVWNASINDHHHLPWATFLGGEGNESGTCETMNLTFCHSQQTNREPQFQFEFEAVGAKRRPKNQQISSHGLGTPEIIRPHFSSNIHVHTCTCTQAHVRKRWSWLQTTENAYFLNYIQGDTENNPSRSLDIWRRTTIKQGTADPSK